MTSSEKASQMPFVAHSLINAKTDERVARLSKVLSTSSGLDATLTLVGYSLSLLSSQLVRLESHSTSPTTMKQTASIASSAKILSGMCSEFRTFTRLWGLLGIYALTKRNYISPPTDAVLRVLAYAQTMALGSYYVYENGAYLASKGVLKGWTPVEMKRWGKVSLRCFLAYLLLEFGRLARVWMMDKKEGEESKKVWRRGFMMNVAYTPLGMHWASENGLLGDGMVGALMSWIGWVKFKTAWAATA